MGGRRDYPLRKILARRRLITPPQPPIVAALPPPHKNALRATTRRRRFTAPHYSPATTTTPQGRAQALINKNKYHAQRAMLTPPRLPASWVGFNAVARTRRRRASTGGAQTRQGRETHAIRCNNACRAKNG